MSTSEAKDSFPILQGSDNHSKWVQHANSILKLESCEDGIQLAKIHDTQYKVHQYIKRLQSAQRPRRGESRH